MKSRTVSTWLIVNIKPYTNAAGVVKLECSKQTKRSEEVKDHQSFGSHQMIGDPSGDPANCINDVVKGSAQ